MEMLMALARHQHFGRAAEACGISQPSFSARIRALEHALGTPVVKRGNRFVGFTQEGEIVLRWARQLTRDRDGLLQEIAAAKGQLTGTVSIGSVPSALPFVARLPAVLQVREPGLRLRIRAASSVETRRGLEDLSLDAGVTYADAAMPAGIRTRPLYAETYVVLAPNGMGPGGGTITWQAAAELPLCLLSPEMRHRRIVDREFGRVGKMPVPILETNDFTAAIAQVADGTAATIAPQVLANILPPGTGFSRFTLTEPVVEEEMALVYLAQDPVPPALEAIFTAFDAIQR